MDSPKKPKKKVKKIKCIGCNAMFKSGYGVYGRIGNPMCPEEGEWCSSECFSSSVENSRDY